MFYCTLGKMRNTLQTKSLTVRFRSIAGWPAKQFQALFLEAVTTTVFCRAECRLLDRHECSQWCVRNCGRNGEGQRTKLACRKALANAGSPEIVFRRCGRFLTIDRYPYVCHSLNGFSPVGKGFKKLMSLRGLGSLPVAVGLSSWMFLKERM